MKWLYKVGANEYHNKLHAIQDNIASANPVTFHAPKEYSAFDFSIEPRETLDQLLKENAKSIRDTHNKVRLYYSGGCDSDLVLRTFVQNKIHIDEIVCWKCGIPSADFEIDNYAIPRLDELSLPGTKITIYQPTMEDYVSYYKQGITEDRINLGVYNFNTHIRILEQIEQFNEVNMQKDVANIRGTTEPIVIQKNNNWYTYFIDVNFEPNGFTHNFFSDDPKIQSKQAHMSLALIKQVGTDVWANEKQWRAVTGRSLANIEFPNKKLLLHSTQNFLTFDSKKIYYANEKEKIALKYLIESNPLVVNLWYENMQSLTKLTNNQWWNNNTPEMGTMGVLSDFYCLTEKSTKNVDELYPDGFKT